MHKPRIDWLPIFFWTSIVLIIFWIPIFVWFHWWIWG